MRLFKAEKSLDALTRYMAAKSTWTNLSQLRVRHSPNADVLNRRRPRQFCHVFPRSLIIHCTSQIENVSEQVRLGLLIHEIGHIVQQAFHDNGDDECEVTVDEWVTYNFPEAGYKFADHRYRSWGGRYRTAKAIEHVSKKFTQLVLKVR
jgi:hypothetical protein